MALHLKSTGIDFADFSDATETSELLDEFEEGTWTPSISFQNGTQESNKGFTNATGFYTKIGRHMFVQFNVNVSYSGGNADNVNMSLPFAISNSGGTQSSGNSQGFTSTSGCHMNAGQGSSTAQFTGGNGGGNISSVMPTAAFCLGSAHFTTDS